MAQAQMRAGAVLHLIGESFNVNRDKNRETAYKNLQRDLMANIDLLHISGLMTMDRVLKEVKEVEEFIRATSASGKSQAELLSEWLNGKDENSVAA